MRFTLCLTVLLFSQCTAVRKYKPLQSYPPANYLINFGGCLGKEHVSFSRITDNLYTDEAGNIYLLTFDRSDETGKSATPVFIRRFPNNCAEHEGGTSADFSKYELASTIDTSTFRYLGNGTYVDKSHRYRLEINADGGSFFPEP